MKFIVIGKDYVILPKNSFNRGSWLKLEDTNLFKIGSKYKYFGILKNIEIAPVTDKPDLALDICFTFISQTEKTITHYYISNNIPNATFIVLDKSLIDKDFVKVVIEQQGNIMFAEED